MSDELLANLDKLHTTRLGVFRIQRNLGLDIDDVVGFCRRRIKKAHEISRKGKNWYILVDSTIITVNARSLCIITAHKEDGKGG